jgi:hypothetical protein
MDGKIPARCSRHVLHCVNSPEAARIHLARELIGRVNVHDGFGAQREGYAGTWT